MGDGREVGEGMKSLSLFSGIGGFDEAFRRAGIECDSVCEIDTACQGILARHFPEAKLFDDVRKVGVATHEKESIDIVCGGFPCQDVSVAGKRAGLAGERSGLWFEFARIIDELEPRWFVIENVPGLLSSNKGRDFAEIVRWLAERGYGVCWRIFDAQYFGVPQRRRRVFIVGSFGNGRAAEVLFESESMSGDIETGRKAGEEVAYSIRANPSHSGDKGDGGINTTMIFDRQRSDEYSTSATVSTVAARDYKSASDLVISPTLQGSGAGTSRLGGQAAEPEFYIATLGHSQAHGLGVGKQLIANTLEGTSSVNQAIAYGIDSQSSNSWKSSNPHSGVHQDRTIKTLDASGPDFTKNQGGSAILQPAVGVRRLTPTECERLQGFPDGWTDGQSDSARYRQLGNAVAVPVVEWIAKRIVLADWVRVKP